MRNMLGALLPRSHLAHPAVDCILPLGPKSLVAAARNVAAKRLIKKLNGIYAGFVEGRTGESATIASDRKAMKDAHVKELANIAREYGKSFAAHRAGSAAAKKSLSSVTAGIGMISDSTSLDEVKKQLDSCIDRQRRRG